MRFVKMHGAGNDFVCVDGFREVAPAEPSPVARAICDRRRGVGADGLVLVLPEPGADARMVVWNADGSRADMCGNALRCVARLLRDAGRGSGDVLRIATDQGILEAAFVGGPEAAGRVRTEIGRPEFERARIPMNGPPGRVVLEPFEAAGRRWAVTALFLGNPHAVVFVDGPGELEGLDLPSIGPSFERHAAFPRRVNAEFVAVLSDREVRQRTWERGVGETDACGSGAAATCVAGVLAGRTGRRITVRLRGGDLGLEWPDDAAPVFVTGPAMRVFEGDWA